MRSFILPVALFAASAMAAPYAVVPECETKGSTVIEYYDVTVTEVVYYTPKPEYHAAPAHTTSRKKHKHPKPTPVPQPTGYVITITEGAPVAAPTSQPEVYSPPPAPYTPPAPYSPPPPVQAAPKPAPPPVQDYSQQPSKTGKFKDDLVNMHNYYRAQFEGLGTVQWMDEAEVAAANWVNTCQWSHSGSSGFGENLAEGSASDYSGYEAAQTWWGERGHYVPHQDYSEQYLTDAGHLTQLLWKGTTHIGCAQQRCGGMTMVVCEYYPQGNVIGAFAENCPGPK